jgi:hypothetical protein
LLRVGAAAEVEAGDKAEGGMRAEAEALVAGGERAGEAHERLFIEC